MARRDKATRAGAVSGALSGISCGIISWLVYAKVGFSLLECTALHCRPEVNLEAYCLWSKLPVQAYILTTSPKPFSPK